MSGLRLTCALVGLKQQFTRSLKYIYYFLNVQVCTLLLILLLLLLLREFPKHRPAVRMTIDRATIHLSPLLHGFSAQRLLKFHYSCDHQAVRTPQITLSGSTSATTEATGIVFIGLLSTLLSHMTPNHPLLWNKKLMSFRRLGDDLFSQIVVNQLVRTETKYPRSVVNRQSLCVFIVSLIIRKSRKTVYLLWLLQFHSQDHKTTKV